jgi:hypothetical protein
VAKRTRRINGIEQPQLPDERFGPRTDYRKQNARFASIIAELPQR